jgi:hypothetical protein
MTFHHSNDSWNMFYSGGKSRAETPKCRDSDKWRMSRSNFYLGYQWHKPALGTHIGFL